VFPNQSVTFHCIVQLLCRSEDDITEATSNVRREGLTKTFLAKSVQSYHFRNPSLQRSFATRHSLRKFSSGPCYVGLLDIPLGCRTLLALDYSRCLNAMLSSISTFFWGAAFPGRASNCCSRRPPLHRSCGSCAAPSYGPGCRRSSQGRTWIHW